MTLVLISLEIENSCKDRLGQRTCGFSPIADVNPLWIALPMIVADIIFHHKNHKKASFQNEVEGSKGVQQ